MANIYVRLPHYIASFLRNFSEEYPIPEGTAIKLDRGDPLINIIEQHAMPNLSNRVVIDCLTERQWVALKQGKPISNDFVIDIVRKQNTPLSLSEIYILSGHQDLVKYDNNGVMLPDTEYHHEYVPFLMPSYVIRNGKEHKVQSDWYMPYPKDFINDLKKRFRRALMEFIDEDRHYAKARGITRSKMESMDRFMLRYDIRTGDRERGQMKKLINRSIEAKAYSFDSDDNHGLWIREHDTAPAKPIRLTRPVFCAETGISYESIAQAARAINVSPDALGKSIKRGFRCAGMHFIFLDEPDPEEKVRRTRLPKDEYINRP